MENLLKFVSNYTLDNHLYYRLNGHEIQWLRETDRWRFRSLGEEGWTYAAPADIEAVLNGAGVDPASFETCLRESVASQAIYAHLVLEKAKETLGDEVIQAAIDDSVRFTRELVAAVRQLTRPQLKVVP